MCVVANLPNFDGIKVRPSDGFTLIELLVSLLLFSLISLAGLSFVETMIRLEKSSSGRLERLADIQRGLFLVNADFGQLIDGPYRVVNDIQLKRSGADGMHTVIYRVDQAGFHRVFDGNDRILISGITHIGWKFAKKSGWSDEPYSQNDASRPRAVELTFQSQSSAGGISGFVRKIIELPAKP